MMRGCSAEVHQEISGDGARKDVRSGARVKVAIYKRVIAGVATQLSRAAQVVVIYIPTVPVLHKGTSLPPAPWC